jgi:hypothetical protein
MDSIVEQPAVFKGQIFLLSNEVEHFLIVVLWQPGVYGAYIQV